MRSRDRRHAQPEAGTRFFIISMSISPDLKKSF